MKKIKQTGFTLIEILVVVAIIGILAGIIITSTVAVRQKAQGIAAKEQVRQIKTALESFFLDHDYYPGVPDTTVVSSDNEHWPIIVNALVPKYASSIPTSAGFYYVYQTGTACSGESEKSCSYNLTLQKIEDSLPPDVLPPPGGDEPPPGDEPPATGSGQNYYIDSSAGDDANSGDDQTKPWRTIAKVNSSMATFQPGDHIYFRRGGTWSEKLTVTVSGTEASPIVFSAYDSGAKPLIDLADSNDFGILVMNQSFLTFQNLAIKRAKNDSGPSAGLALANTNNVVADGLDIDNVKGVGGVFIWSSGVTTGKNNLIKNCSITNTTGTAYSRPQGNNGIGIQLWAECETCGPGNRLEGNTVSGNGGHGIGLFMPQTTVLNNTVRLNNEMGIGVAQLVAHDLLIKGNLVEGNCQYKDDCFGINLFRVGANNLISDNTVRSQKDTLNDPSIPANDGYAGYKFGTGGIRFDGGDKTQGSDLNYMETTGNVISGNNISDEYDATQVFNFNNITISGNTISASRHAALHAGADNTADGGSTKPITVTFTNNNVSGLGVVIYSNPAGLVTINN